MADYEYNFPDKSTPGLVNFFERNPVGENFASFMGESFSSVTQAIHRTEPAGNASVVHLLTGDTLTFDGVSKPRLAHIFRTVGAYFGFQQ